MHSKIEREREHLAIVEVLNQKISKDFLLDNVYPENKALILIHFPIIILIAIMAHVDFKF